VDLRATPRLAPRRIACLRLCQNPRRPRFADGKIIYRPARPNGSSPSTDNRYRPRGVGALRSATSPRRDVHRAPIVVKNHVLLATVRAAELGVRGLRSQRSTSKSARIMCAPSTPGRTASEDRSGVSFILNPRTRGRISRHVVPSEQWKLGGSTVWGWISYDPETNLFFYGTCILSLEPDLRRATTCRARINRPRR